MNSAPIDLPSPPRSEPVDPTRRYATLTFMRGALVALGVAIGAGMLGVLYYVAPAMPVLRSLGIDFTVLRPIHTTFTSAWIFLGGMAVVHRYLQDRAGSVGTAERWLLRAQVLLWAVAGLGILGSVLAGVSSGREYMGFHPLLSIPILLGWLCFTINFFRHTWRGFMSQPVYISMWGVGALFFMYTFIEQHLWLFRGVFAEPVVDLRLQWKACGTLVGSFNLFVYGSLYYISEKVSGNERYAHSRLAYLLFAVGLLNSFTNFGHHTYHLPQSWAVKWIAFVISMTEIVILAKVAWDIMGNLTRRVAAPFDTTRCFLNATRWWTMAILGSAILISMPPLNALIHGTHVVTGHAMGSEIGIDTMVLFAAIAWLLTEQWTGRVRGDFLNARSMRFAAIGFNACSAVLVLWLHFSGSVVGYYRYLHELPPAWLILWSPYVFGVAGFATASFLIFLLARWSSLAFAPATHLTAAATDRILEKGRQPARDFA